MSRRAGDWSLVGRDSDPVPADGSAVDRLAAEFEGRGRDMTTAADVLSRLAKRTEWVGKAGESFADEAGSTHEDLADAARKYVDAGKALRTFSEAVFHAHNETWAGLLAAELADGDRARNADPAPGSAVPAATPDPAAEAEESRRRARLLQAQDELAAARRRVDKAMHALDEAAQRARKAIDAASGHYKDGFWDDVKGFVSTAIKALLDVLNVLAIIVAALIIVLVVIGTGGAALAFLIPAAFWIGVAIFGLTAVQVGMGDADGRDLGWAALGLVGGGVGKGGAALGRSGLGAMQRVVGQQAERAVRDALPGVVRRGLTDFGPRSRTAAQAIIDGRVERALQGVDGAVRAAEYLPRRGLQVVSKITEMDDAVTTIRQIRALREMATGPVPGVLRSYSGAGVQATGALMGLIAQGHDVKELPDTLGGIPDDLRDYAGERAQLEDAALRSASNIVGVGR